MVVALGREDWLVARSHECDFPESVKHLPVVTRANVGTGNSQQIHNQVRARLSNGLSLYDVDEPMLKRLAPDLILTQDQCEVCAVTPADVERAARELTQATTEVISIKPFTLEEVFEEFCRISVALEAREQAEALIKAWRQRLASLKPAGASLVILEWLEPLLGCGYWTPELVRYAGCEEPLGQPGDHAIWLDRERLRAADPDILVLAPCGLTLPRVLEEAQRLSIDTWRDLRAVREGRLYAVDANAYLSRSGPRLIDSAEILNAISHGRTSGPGFQAI